MRSVRCFARRADAFARQDVVTLTADYAEDCVVVSALSGSLVGRAAVATTFRTFFGAFPDFTFTNEELLMFGDKAERSSRWSATEKSTDVRSAHGRQQDHVVYGLVDSQRGDRELETGHRPRPVRSFIVGTLR